MQNGIPPRAPRFIVIDFTRTRGKIIGDVRDFNKFTPTRIQLYSTAHGDRFSTRMPTVNNRRAPMIFGIRVSTPPIRRKHLSAAISYYLVYKCISVKLIFGPFIPHCALRARTHTHKRRTDGGYARLIFARTLERRKYRLHPCERIRISDNRILSSSRDARRDSAGELFGK
jgi:hypothetical protein